MLKKYILLLPLLLIFTSTIAQTSYDVTSVDGRYQLCSQLGISEWNGIEIDGDEVRIGSERFYKDDKNEGYGYYKLSEARYWDPVGSISIGRTRATITWRRMECRVTLITPEGKKIKEAQEQKRREEQRAAKRAEDARREREKKEKIASDKKQYYKIDKALKNKLYEKAVSLSSGLNFSYLYPNREGINTAVKEIEKRKDILRVERTKNFISSGKIDSSISTYDSLSESSNKEMVFNDIADLFVSVYTQIEYNLSSKELEDLITVNKTKLSSFDPGSYLLKVSSNGINEGLPTSLNLQPMEYKKSDFVCNQGYSVTIEITNKEDVIEKNIYTRKGGKICKALIGKKRYRSNFWTKSKIWESDCIDSKSDLSLMKKDLVYRGTYNSQKFANGYKIDERVITRDDTKEVLNQRIPKIIWRALTLPIQGIYYIALYLF